VCTCARANSTKFRSTHECASAHPSRSIQQPSRGARAASAAAVAAAADPTGWDAPIDFGSEVPCSAHKYMHIAHGQLQKFARHEIRHHIHGAHACACADADGKPSRYEKENHIRNSDKMA